MKTNKIKRKDIENKFGVKTTDNILTGNGKYGITVITLEKLAKLLNVKTIDLIEEW